MPVKNGYFISYIYSLLMKDHTDHIIWSFCRKLAKYTGFINKNT